MVQMQHEARRKELEFERLQERCVGVCWRERMYVLRYHQAKAALYARHHPPIRLRTLLSEGRKQERVALDMVGKLALGKPGVGTPLSARAARSNEGLQVRVRR